MTEKAKWEQISKPANPKGVGGVYRLVCGDSHIATVRIPEPRQIGGQTVITPEISFIAPKETQEGHRGAIVPPLKSGEIEISFKPLPW
jgi:hypothetical protein